MAVGAVLLLAGFMPMPWQWGGAAVEVVTGEEASAPGDHPPSPDVVGGTLLRPGEG